MEGKSWILGRRPIHSRMNETSDGEMMKSMSNLVNVAQDDFFDRVVLQDLSDDATITASDDEHFFRVRVGCEREMCDHLLVPISLYISSRNVTSLGGDVRELVALSALYDTIENQDVTVCLGLEDEDVLVERFFNVEDFVDPESHGLSRPLGRDLPEPTICKEIMISLFFSGFMTISPYREWRDEREETSCASFGG